MAKRTFVISLLMGMAVSFCLAGDDVQRIPRVSYVDGDASLQESGDTGWSTIDVNLPLQSGDRLVLEREGLLEVEVDDGSFIRLNQFSELTVNRLRDDEIILGLPRGELIMRVRSEVNYIIQTPMGDAVLNLGGLYRINVRNDGSVELLVRQGKARFVSGPLEKKVTEGKRLLVVDRSAEAVAGPAGQLDDFDSWSERRDARYASNSDSYRYIPREVAVGVYDLDYFGRWVYLADYGYCWAPITYAPGWSPYRYGYWRYSPYWGWAWISYDPWGWLPYHYGSWWCSASFGWVWVPGAYWGVNWWSPACVHFGYWNNYVGWCPVGPADYHNGYWRPGHHGGSHDNGHYNHNYNPQNSRSQDSVTYVSADDFRQGRPIGHGVYSRNTLERGSARSTDAVSFRGDPSVSRELFRRENIQDGAPRVEPVRSSSATYVRSRGGVSGDGASAAGGSYRGTGSVTTGGTGRSRDGSAVTERGNAGSENPSTSRSTNFGSSFNSDYSNRGRPEVSRGGMQDSSRSRQPEETSGGSGGSNRSFYRDTDSTSSRGSESRNPDLDRGSSGRSVSGSSGSESRGTTRSDASSMRSSSGTDSSSGNRSTAPSSSTTSRGAASQLNRTGSSGGSSVGSGGGASRPAVSGLRSGNSAGSGSVSRSSGGSVSRSSSAGSSSTRSSSSGSSSRGGSGGGRR